VTKVKHAQKNYITNNWPFTNTNNSILQNATCLPYPAKNLSTIEPGSAESTKVCYYILGNLLLSLVNMLIQLHTELNGQFGHVTEEYFQLQMES